MPSAPSERTILVVEDEEHIRLMLEDVLSVHYCVCSARDGVDALEQIAARQGEIDLVITDLRMPRMDGMELAAQIRAQYPHLGLIIITAHGTIAEAVEALKSGIYDYITKPLPADLKEIYAKCERYFQMRALQQKQEHLQQEILNLSYFPRSNPHLVARAIPTQGEILLYAGNEKTLVFLARAAGEEPDAQGCFRYGQGGIAALFPPDFPSVLHRIVHSEEIVEVDRLQVGDRCYQHTYTPFVGQRDEIFVNITDITERQRAEDALRKSEARFRSIFEHSNDAIFLIDPERDQILDANPKACRILGYEREELLALPISAVHPDEMPKLLDFARSVASRGQGWTDELNCLTRSGHVLDAEISASIADIGGRSCIVSVIRDLTERQRAAQLLEDEVKAKYNYEEIVGKSPRLQEVLQQVELVAPTDASVLILGETGTGKELICRALHHTSRRRAEPLVKLNCAAIPSGLIESELFGHEKGAFTGAIAQKRGRFELAHGGTLFLDEIGDLPLETQPKLLRLLQEQEFERVGGTRTIKVDVRVVAATHSNLELRVGEGQFREDLFYRLNVFPLQLPPLRERCEDISLLAVFFAHRICARLGRPPTEFSAAALERLQAYSWPGNVRELENIVERAVILSKGREIDARHILVQDAAPAPNSGRVRTLEEVEREHILAALHATRGKVSGRGGAAELLDLKPTTLDSRMRKLGINADES